MQLVPKLEFKGKNPFIAPCWCMKSSDKKEDCNMEMHSFPSQVISVSSARLKLPYTSNFKAVEAGNALVVFKPKVEKPVEELQDVADEREVKRRRYTKGA